MLSDLVECLSRWHGCVEQPLAWLIHAKLFGQATSTILVTPKHGYVYFRFD